jgi:hypothetical protein
MTTLSRKQTTRSSRTTTSAHVRRPLPTEGSLKPSGPTSGAVAGSPARTAVLGVGGGSKLGSCGFGVRFWRRRRLECAGRPLGERRFTRPPPSSRDRPSQRSPFLSLPPPRLGPRRRAPVHNRNPPAEGFGRWIQI